MSCETIGRSSNSKVKSSSYGLSGDGNGERGCGERRREEDGKPHLQVLDVVTRPGMELESMLIVILVT